MAYPTDLTDSQWELIEEFFDTGNYGKNRRHSKRVLVNAVFYVIKTGMAFLTQRLPALGECVQLLQSG